MLRIILVMTLSLGFGSAFAQPGPHPLVPPSWPLLRSNSSEPPSCVFGTTIGPGGTPAYFCAVIIRAPNSEPPPITTASGAIAGLFVNSTTGAVTPIAPMPLSITPTAVKCVLINSSPNCLFTPSTAMSPNGGPPIAISLATVVGGALVESSGTAAAGIEQPPTAAGATIFVSNFSCVSNTCFVLDQYGQIRQWTFFAGKWTTPQNVAATSGLKSPGTRADLSPARLENGRQILSCTSSAATAPPDGRVDCFVRTAAGELLTVSTVSTSTFSAQDGLTWNPNPTSTSGPILGTDPSCLSAVVGETDCFFGFVGGPSSKTGLGSMPDNASRPPSSIFITEPFPRGAVLQRSNVKIPPSCITFATSPSPGAFECVFDYNAGVALPSAVFRDAVIFLATTNAFPNFSLQSLGVAAPTQELSIGNIAGRPIRDVVALPKAVSALACAKGPDFQSLCTANVVSPMDPALVKKYRVAFKLVGALGSPPAPPPSGPTDRSPKKGVRPK
jgi:hypothetical protein